MTIEIGVINGKLPGLPGLSAYELAVKQGFVGTLEEWLLSLKGQRGLKGDQGLRGLKGDKGDDALSAYELAVELGFTGSEEDWFSQFDNSTIIETAKSGLVIFKTIWNTRLVTEGSSDYNQIRLPLVSTGTYDFTVNWGDGQTNHITNWFSLDAIHTYSEPGIYLITIEGELVGWRFNNTQDRCKLLCIEQWGQIKLGTTEGNYFYGCTELNILTKDRLNLQGTINLDKCFKDCTNLTTSSQLSYWDVKEVTSMAGMFSGCIKFNTDLSSWDITNVKDLRYFLFNTYSFSDDYYTELLMHWSDINLNGNVIMHASSKYKSEAIVSRQNIINNSNWIIIDGGLA